MTQQAVNEYCWGDLKVGLRQEFEVSITNIMMLHFLRDAGDCNPLHVNELYARSNGFRSRVVYGLLTSSFYSTLAGVYLPGKRCLLHGIDVSFSGPAYVGDQLTVDGEITHLNDAYRRIEMRAKIVNAGGEVISKAKIRAGLLDAGNPAS